MIVENTVKMTWNGRNKRHFVTKGYEYTKQRDEFIVKVNDLQPTSHAIIKVACDNCNKPNSITYRDYLTRKYNEYLCSNCANEKYGINTRHRIHIAKGNSLGKWGVKNIHPDFIKNYWSNENSCSPFDLAYGCDESIYIKCPNNIHEDYSTTPYRFAFRTHNCPECVRERDESFLQEKVRLYLEELCGKENIAHEYKCSILPKNIKTNRRLPFDNEIIDLKTIIEVMGLQHYRITSWTINSANKANISPEKYLEYQKWKDNFKRQYAIEQGYHYLDIPYWAEKDDYYKVLIDNKIKEVKLGA